MKVALVLLLLLVAGCSSSGSTSDADPPAAPTSWIGMQPGDARAFDGPGGEVVLIYVDETYDFTDVADTYASALTWKHGDDYTTDYWIQDDDGTLWWYGRKGSWRAGKNGAEPREVAVENGQARFGDHVIMLSDDGPTEVETPDGTYTLTG